jgi:hypothetical protein
MSHRGVHAPLNNGSSVLLGGAQFTYADATSPAVMASSGEGERGEAEHALVRSFIWHPVYIIQYSISACDGVR